MKLRVFLVILWRNLSGYTRRREQLRASLQSRMVDQAKTDALRAGFSAEEIEEATDGKPRPD